MSMKRLVTMGCLSVMVAAGVANASEDTALTVQGVKISERIGVDGSVYSSSQPNGSGPCSVTRATITRRIGQGGSTYYTKSHQAGECNGNGRMVDVIERIGVGGSVYFSSRPLG